MGVEEKQTRLSRLLQHGLSRNPRRIYTEMNNQALYHVCISIYFYMRICMYIWRIIDTETDWERGRGIEGEKEDKHVRKISLTATEINHIQKKKKEVLHICKKKTKIVPTLLLQIFCPKSAKKHRIKNDLIKKYCVDFWERMVIPWANFVRPKFDVICVAKSSEWLRRSCKINK